MTTTSHQNFNDTTEAVEVAAAFPEAVRGKTILVTGVNIKGIGFATAEAFASQAARLVIVAGRTPSKLDESIQVLRSKYPAVEFRALKLNLASQKDVRTAAKELLSWSDVPAINTIVNSAGVMLLPIRTLTEDGIETTFATNHIGHFLFTNLILSKLIKATENNPRGSTRIINVSSLSPLYGCIRWSDINFDKVNKTLPESEQPMYGVQRRWAEKDPENASYLPLEAYSQSKVANVLFSIGASQRLYHKYGILSFAVHPGIIQTELARDAPTEMLKAIDSFAAAKENFYRSQSAGAACSFVAALDPKLSLPENKGEEENWGSYLVDCQISDKARPLAKSSSEADRLWKFSEELVGEQFSW